MATGRSITRSGKPHVVPSGKWLELGVAHSPEHEGIVSGCEVNRLIARLYGERLPSIDLAHVDLSRASAMTGTIVNLSLGNLDD